MKRKHLATLVLGGMITTLHGEDFINTDKELKNFSTLYDFGAPIRSKKNENKDMAVEETTPTRQEASSDNASNATVHPAPYEVASPVRELNITCGAKCGIPFFPDSNATLKE